MREVLGDEGAVQVGVGAVVSRVTDVVTEAGVKFVVLPNSYMAAKAPALGKSSSSSLSFGWFPPVPSEPDPQPE